MATSLCDPRKDSGPCTAGPPCYSHFRDDTRKPPKQLPSPCLHGFHLKAVCINSTASNFSSCARSSAAQRCLGQILAALAKMLRKGMFLAMRCCDFDCSSTFVSFSLYRCTVFLRLVVCHFLLVLVFLPVFRVRVCALRLSCFRAVPCFHSFSWLVVSLVLCGALSCLCIWFRCFRAVSCCITRLACRVLLVLVFVAWFCRLPACTL